MNGVLKRTVDAFGRIDLYCWNAGIGLVLAGGGEPEAVRAHRQRVHMVVVAWEGDRLAGPDWVQLPAGFGPQLRAWVH